MGSVDNVADFSVPKEAQKIFEKGILNNALIPELPWELKAAGKHVTFTGSQLPLIPINWRFAESIAVLKAFEASMLNVLRVRKYRETKVSEVTINTDHASLFVMSPMITQFIDKDGEAKPVYRTDPQALAKAGFPSTDLHRAGGNVWRGMATNIYRTKDGRYYHTHGSMNPEPTLTALGMSLEGSNDVTEFENLAKQFEEVVSKRDAEELDRTMNDKYRQAGTIAYTKEEFMNSEHGKANAHVALYEISRSAEHAQPKCWWPEQESMPSSAKRPLAGLKVVDLTRVIAAPTVTRSLAEMGASVMRVTSPLITDMSLLHQDLNWGKWNTHLHLKNEEDRQKLIELIKEADVVVEGYRPAVMEKYGLSREDIFNLVKDRDRGIIHVKENCYGWYGPWSYRSGWQQISDAVCGVSRAYGKAMGVEGAVTPVFPNSDFCTGVAGSVGILHALIRRADEGGSFGVDCSLNYYSQWLVQSVGEYPPEIWRDVWDRHGSPVFKNYHSMAYLLPRMIGLLKEHDGKTLFNQDFFEKRRSKAVGTDFVQIKPVAQWKDGAVDLSFNVGTRGNGVDKPFWPKDLTTEIVV